MNEEMGVPTWIIELQGGNTQLREKSPGELLGPEPTLKLTARGADHLTDPDPARDTLLYGGLVVSGLPHLSPSDFTVSSADTSPRGG